MKIFLVFLAVFVGLFFSGINCRYSKYDYLIRKLDYDEKKLREIRSQLLSDDEQEDDFPTETDINLHYYHERQQRRELGNPIPDEEFIDMELCEESPNSPMCIENPGDDILQDHSNLFKADAQDANKRAVVARDSNLWPGGVVPYVFDSKFLKDKIPLVKSVMEELFQKTGVKWEPKKENQKHFVKIQSSALGCFSYVGYVKRAGQELNLYENRTRRVTCFRRGIIAHEMLHAMGFYHEQSRPDRDRFVRIDTGKARANTHHNFRKVSNARHCGKYDYGSVMHYSSRAFAKTRNDLTIIPVGDDVQNKLRLMGQRNGLSEADIKEVRHFYKIDGATCDDNDCKKNEVYNDDQKKCVCLPGYKNESGSCQDINECEASTNPCQGNAQCVNNEGSFTCKCPQGYKKDGNDCKDINECEQRSPCGSHGNCTNTDGSFTCECDDGFEKTGDGSCKDINECEEGSFECEDGKVCVNTPGDYDCVDPNRNLFTLDEICETYGRGKCVEGADGPILQCSTKNCLIFEHPLVPESSKRETSINPKYFCVSWAVNGRGFQRVSSIVQIWGVKDRRYTYFRGQELSKCQFRTPDRTLRSENRDYVYTNTKLQDNITKLRVRLYLYARQPIRPSVNITNFKLNLSNDQDCLALL